jgi:hypothetical protein
VRVVAAHLVDVLNNLLAVTFPDVMMGCWTQVGRVGMNDSLLHEQVANACASCVDCPHWCDTQAGHPAAPLRAPDTPDVDELRAREHCQTRSAQFMIMYWSENHMRPTTPIGNHPAAMRNII